MRSTTARHDIDRDLVLRHLRRLGNLADTPQAAPTPLPVGIAGVALERDGVLTVDGQLAHGTPRRVSELFSAGSHPPYLADSVLTATMCHSGHDPVMYHAFRHFLPPRDLRSGRHLPADPSGAVTSGPGRLLADLVIYQPGELPGDEPFRSTGHWNLPGQLEIFQVLTGRVAMLVAGRNRSAEPFAYVQVCQAGETMAVPFEVWHVSYVLDGPAAVFNVTTMLEAGPVGAGAGVSKYSRSAPVAITVRREGPDLRCVSTPAAMRIWGEPGEPPRIDWLHGLLSAGQSLADLHLHGTPEQLEAIVQAAREAYRQGWPVSDLKPCAGRSPGRPDEGRAGSGGPADVAPVAGRWAWM
ncbi:hypothetical protein [Dactylosporangium sp. CA-233914]|uniref:hypothetical protein n=1 Tax=Dactylosporangium sp. CA-233914 TaxID=3239934 RepID=UPI003D938678